MVAAITIDGYIATRVVPGSFNAEEFRDYITEQVVCVASHIKGPFILMCLDHRDESISCQPKYSGDG